MTDNSKEKDSHILVRKSDEDWMQYALDLAKKAAQLGEVPVGAVLVKNNQLIAEGWNQPISHNDPTAHAEIIAIRHAGKKMENYRLPDTTLYVTIEPCSMCAGAIIHARISRLVFGAPEPRAGAVGSANHLLQDKQLNHQVEITSGILAEQCSLVLKNFFRAKRKKTSGE